MERRLAAILTADVLGYRRLTRDVDLIDQGPLMGWTDRAPRRTLRFWGADNRRSTNHVPQRLLR